MPEFLTPFLKWFPWRAVPCLAALAGKLAAQEVQTFPVNQEDGTGVEVEHVFSVVPPCGYTAVRVTLNNKGKQELTLTVRLEKSITPSLTLYRWFFKQFSENGLILEFSVRTMRLQTEPQNVTMFM